MATSVTPAPESARPAPDGRDRPLAELEHELSADPWHFLRRACQVADYDTTSFEPKPRSTPRAAP